MKFQSSDNEAECEASIYALKEAKRMGATKIQLFTNYKIMATQFGGLYQAKNNRMSAYLDVIRNLAK